MPGGINLSTKYSKYIDERWTMHSQIALVSGKFNFKGDRTCVIYSIPTAPLQDYRRYGLQRYGTPDDLTRNIQTLTVTQDKGFSFILDKGDEIQSESIVNPGSSLDREIRHEIVPRYDEYCFRKLAESAVNRGHYSSTAVTKANAYEMFLNGVQHMADRDVPMNDVVAYCTFAFSNLLMQDPAFVRYGDVSQGMLERGELGMADGVKIVRVTPSRLPYGAAFLLVHKDAIVAPRQLESYITHTNPVGVNGTVCEGRVIFDCFVLNEKSAGIYYHGGQSGLKLLRAATGAAPGGKSKLMIYTEPEKNTNKWYAKTAAAQASLPAVSPTTAIDISASGTPWYGGFEVTANELEFTPAEGHSRLRLVEVQANNKPIGFVDLDIYTGN